MTENSITVRKVNISDINQDIRTNGYEVLSEVDWYNKYDDCITIESNITDEFIIFLKLKYLDIQTYSDIIKDPWLIYNYTKYGSGERWPEAESVITTDPIVTFLYAINVVKARWPEAEQRIYDTGYREQYERFITRGE